jgi:hypothetical protein
MEEVAAIVDRLARIDRLRREEAPAGVVLQELRDLLAEAESWAQVEGGEAGERAVSRLRAALSRDLAAV